ncbi:MAG TPA: dicarboxylate/amino acid:cation symporter [Gammaproteobacteria bacterium]|nr:dicarboxylate/amino acid:cation symporter [Gammaproteobacteria bacterium]
MPKVKLELHWQILIALALAVVAGFLTGTDGGLFGISAYSVYGFLGALFLNALKMLIVPLIASTIITGVAGLGKSGSLGRLGGRTLLFYAITTLAAIFAGLLMVDLITPGIINGEPARHLLGLDAAGANVAASVGRADSGDLVGIFLQMVPPNIIAAAAEGQMLGLIFFSLLFGYFMTRVESPVASTVQSFWEGVAAVMMKMTEWVMKFAPIGVFGLVAKVIAETGFSAFKPLLTFAVAVIAAYAIHALVTMPLLIRFVAKASPLKMYRAMGPALLTAFSTASSSATLPVTMESVEKDAGVSNRISSFVLPLGATVNMNGTALYECVAAIFIAQAYGLDLSFATQFTIVITALLTSVGVAGIPSASMVAIAIILKTVGLPFEAVGVLFAIDRPLDMMRTSLNVFGDSVCALIVARYEGEEGLLGIRQPAVPVAEAGLD